MNNYQNFGLSENEVSDYLSNNAEEQYKIRKIPYNYGVAPIKNKNFHNFIIKSPKTLKSTHEKLVEYSFYLKMHHFFLEKKKKKFK